MRAPKKRRRAQKTLPFKHTTRGRIVVYLQGRFERGEIASKRQQCQQGYKLNRFAEIAPEDPSKIKRSHADKFRAGMVKEGLAISSQRTYQSVVRQFCAWLVREGHLASNPFDELKLPRAPRTVPRGLTKAQVAAILAHCSSVRDRAIVLLMVQEGLRCVEVSRLLVGHIDMAERAVFIEAGKGDHQRIVPLTTETRRAIKEYLAESPASASSHLIRSTGQGREHLGIGPPRVSALVAKIMREAG
ncbi:MAG: tyrosine-type recombinase/integrase [Acidimicrobiales bacterium]